MNSRILLFLLSFASFTFSYPRVIALHKITDLVPLVSQVIKKHTGQKVLAAFDIDNTLLHPNNANGWASDQWLEAHVKRLIEQEHIDPKKAWNALLPLYFEIQKHPFFTLIPVEKETLTVFMQVQQSVNKTIGLTARSLPILYDTLRLVNCAGISFEQSAFGSEVQFVHEYVAYQKGIIFCGNFNKGLALLHLCNTEGYRPDMVIFVDDKLKNIHAVEGVLTENNIECIGIHYKYLEEKVQAFSLHSEWGCVE